MSRSRISLPEREIMNGSSGEMRRSDQNSSIEEKLSAAMDSAQQKAVESIRPAKEGVQSFLERQKEVGAEQIGGVASAVHGAARELERGMPGMARTVHDAAARLDRASASLRDGNPEEIIAAIGRFAREQPAVFFGGAVLAGFALSRFLKSSAARRG
jgi:hypothetical protein